VEPLTLTEARALLAASADHRLQARWLVGLSLGLRQGEVLGLQWSDVDLEAGRLHVRRSLRRQPDGTLLLTPPKTTRSNRVIPMPERLTSALAEHQARQAEARLILGEEWVDSCFVFTTALGTPIHPRNDYRAFQALLRKAGLRRFRLHDLRHTAASLLLAQGVSPRVVMEILGHMQISSTMNTYSHVDTTLTKEAVERVGEALWPEND
jgi:integrase